VTDATRSRESSPARSPAAIEYTGAFDSDIRHSTIVGAAGSGIRLRKVTKTDQAVDVSSTYWSGVMLVCETRTRSATARFRDTGYDGNRAQRGSDIRIEATLLPRQPGPRPAPGEGVRTPL
jgi:hypothetical protein